MNQAVRSKILSAFRNSDSLGIAFTPAAEIDIVENIEEWFHDEFIHILFDLGMDQREMTLKFTK